MTLKELLWEPTRKGYVQAFRAIVVGGICVVFDFALMNLIRERLGWQEWLCTACGYLLGTIINYVLGLVWLFKMSSSGMNRKAEFGVFCIISAIGFGCNAGMMHLLTDGKDYGWLTFNLIRMGIVAVVFVWTFGARKFLYRKKAE